MGKPRLAPQLVLLAALAWPAMLTAQFNDPPAPAAYALQNVTVVRADGNQLVGVNLVVRAGLIEAMGAEVAIPADAKLLEGDSLYVYPGIVDAQGTVDYEIPEIEVDRNEIASWDPPRHVQGFMPHRRLADHLTATGEDLADFRQKGVVAAAVHPEGALAPGRGMVLVFRKSAGTSAELVAHPVIGPAMSFQGARGVYPSTLFAVIAFYRQTFEDTRYRGAQMAAYDRDPRGLTAPAWDADLEVMEQLLNGATPAFFAADFGRDIQRVLMLAAEYGFRPVIVGGDEAWQVADELKAAGVPVLVSLDFPEPERWKPKKNDEPEPTNGDGDVVQDELDLDAGALREKQRLEDLYSNPGRLAAQGVPFALTSGGGSADIREGARKAIEYGLSEQDALRAVTVTPASLLGIEEVVRVEPSLAATFIVADGPLFAEETKIRYTFVEGELEEGKKERAGSGEAPAVVLTGSWEMSMETGMGTFTSTLTVEQDGGSFEGTTRSEMGEGRVVNGEVSGNNVNFTVIFSMGDETIEIEFTGTAEGDSASGSGEAEMVGSFDWTAKRVGGPEEEIDR
jgi:hypothetical protein